MLKDRLEQRLRTLRISQSALARKAGLSAAFISDLMCGRKNSVRAENLARLAEALEVPVAYLVAPTALSALNVLAEATQDASWDDDTDRDLAGSGSLQQNTTKQSATPLHHGLARLPTSARPPARTLRPWASDEIYKSCDPTGSGAWAPVFSTPDPDRPDEIIVRDGADGRLRLPPQLIGTATYAVRVTGTGMEPRYWRGEILYCTPDRSVIGCKYVAIVQQRANEKRITLGRIRLYGTAGLIVRNEADHAERQVRYDDDVVAIHRIVLSGEDLQA